MRHLTADFLDGGRQFLGRRGHRLDVGGGFLGGGGHGGGLGRGFLGIGGHGPRGGFHLGGGGGHLRHHALDVALEAVGLASQFAGDDGGGVGLDIDRGGQIHVQIGRLVDGGDDPGGHLRLFAIGFDRQGEHLVQHEAITGGIPPGFQADALMDLADLGHVGEVIVVEITDEHRIQPMLLLHGGGMGDAFGGRELDGDLGIAFDVGIERIK
ncbi:MAG: hypothetical protein FD119_659 [Stygiobacter sp.]|nr:MAG: hypothetical protein FD119_659 [Stygiobacter sp.]